MKNNKEVKKEPEFERLLGYQEIARITGLTVAFLTKAKREKGLNHYKIGGMVKFKPSEVFKWIEDQKVAG